ncbi:MAG TPA: dihydroneopterin aldolase [Candidatus Limnocylindria bacterium]
MSDRITLRGMRFLGRHGVELEERLEPQPFEVDVILRGAISRAAASDDLADTVDYSAVFTTVQGIVEEQSFRLIEALAGTIADTLLTDPAIQDVEVRVRKPKAPLPGAFDTVEVRLRRRAAAE